MADFEYRGWISASGWAGVNIDDFPTLKKWEERMWARPSLKKGANVPDPYRMKELLQDKEAMEKHAAQVSWLNPYYRFFDPLAWL